MNAYIKSKKANCKNCYKCIRHCPVKSIRFSNSEATIVSDECILCGRCYVVCPQGAKYVVSEREKIEELLDSGAPVIVSLAPSFIANFEEANISSMRRALMALGFSDVQETAVGATIVKKKYEELLQEDPTQTLISSCCPVINTLIETRYPQALPYLAPVDSPLLAHAKKIKQEKKEAKVVFIGPCIGKKTERGQYPELIDGVLTFEELADWLDGKEEIKELLRAEETDNEEGYRARSFPTTGGIIKSMVTKRDDVNYVSIDGVKNCMRALQDIMEGKVNHCFIEMSACIGSCVGGPAMSKEHRHPVSDVMKVNEYAGPEDYRIQEEEVPEITRSFHFSGVHQSLPGGAAIEEILRKMGKKTKEDELNCGSCGYNSCREKAAAVYMGKADLSMCLPFLLEKAESFSDNIIGNTPNGILVLSKDLMVQQINRAACGIMNISRASDILDCPVVRILDPVDCITVANTKENIHDKRIYLAEYGKYVEETILYDDNYEILILIMRDVTEEERQARKKEEISRHTVEITDKVIDKQMRVVQEIASLLGETTAETKVALSNLKETLENE